MSNWRSLTDMSKLRSLTDMSKLRSLTDMSNMRSLIDMSKLRSLTDMSKLRSLTDMSKLRSLTDMSKLRSLTDMSKLRSLTDMRNWLMLLMCCKLAGGHVLTAQNSSPLLKLSTHNGEQWALLESEPVGYLALDTPSNGQSWVVVSKAPDLETISESSDRRRESLPFVLECTFHDWIYKYKQELIISDVNEHAPTFDLAGHYNIDVKENTLVGSSVFSIRHLARDPDTTGFVSFYTLHPYKGREHDGWTFFTISGEGGHLVLSRPLDYDKLLVLGRNFLKLNLSATDNGVPHPLSSHTTLTVRVLDVDDQGPTFVYADCRQGDNFCSPPFFQTTVACSFQGVLRLYPGPLQAIDSDTQNHSIVYSISQAEPPHIVDKLTINEWTGQIELHSLSCPSDVQEVLLTVTATEQSMLQHRTSATVEIKLLGGSEVRQLDGSEVRQLDGSEVKQLEGSEVRQMDGSEVRQLDGSEFLNGAWNPISDNSNVSQSNSPISLTLFLIAVLVVLVVGSAIAVVTARVTHNKKHNILARACSQVSSQHSGQVSSHHAGQVSSHHAGQVSSHHAGQGAKTSSCCQSCLVDCGPQPFRSWALSKLPSTKLAHARRRSLHVASDHKTGTHVHPPEMWTAFRTTNSSSSSFSPTPNLPGQSLTRTFYDGTSSLGSMKHERTTKRAAPDKVTGWDNVGAQQVKVTNLRPDFRQAAFERVHLNDINLSQSSV